MRVFGFDDARWCHPEIKGTRNVSHGPRRCVITHALSASGCDVFPNPGLNGGAGRRQNSGPARRETGLEAIRDGRHR